MDATLTLAAPATETRRTTPRGRGLVRHLLPWALPVALALGWEAVVAAGLAEGRLFPPPSAIFQTLAALASAGDLWTHAEASLTRVGWGFLAGALTGTLLGGLTAAVPRLRQLLDPSLQALRAIPSIAWVPLFVLWFGIFEAPKIALIALGVFFPVYLGVLGAVLGVDRRLVEVGRVFRFGRTALLTRILLPAILPAWVLALRAGLGLGWMFVVAAELMGASEGLGWLLLDGQQTGRAAQIVAAIVAFGLLGRLTDLALAAAAAPFLRWQDDYARTQEHA